MALARPSTNIHSLPVELLSCIFVIGAFLDDPYASSPFLLKPDLGCIPLPASNIQVVAHVCRHWRQIALHTQPLWTTIHIREKIHIPRAVEYLSRCRTSTYRLDILIDTVSVDDHTSEITLYKDELTSIFTIIVPHVKHWRSFHLKICDNECKVIARRFLSSCGPGANLETLQLYHFEDFRTAHRLYLATHRPPVTIFDNNLPCLKNVSLIGVNLPWHESLYLCNLRHLELALHLDNVRPPYRWWERILRESPALQSLTLHYSGPKESTGVTELAWTRANDKIQLPQLKELSFKDLDPAYLLNVFERLHVPGLKRLTLDLREQDFTPFIEFLTSPPEQLHSTTSGKHDVPFSQLRHQYSELPVHIIGRLDVLIIRGLECSLTSWEALLHATRGLRFLEVAFSRTSAGFWKVFTQEGNPQSVIGDFNGQSELAIKRQFLPHLEVFKLSGVSGKDILLALSFQHSRSQQVTPRRPKKWCVRWSERRRGRDPELDALVDQGLWEHKEGCSTAQVLIEIFDEFEIDDDEEDVEEVDEEPPSTGDDDESEADKDAPF